MRTNKKLWHSRVDLSEREQKLQECALKKNKAQQGNLSESEKNKAQQGKCERKKN